MKKEKPGARKKTADADNSEKRQKTVKVFKLIGFIALSCIFCVLLVNAMLNIFVKDYYPSFGKNRLFAVVTDSMEPEIPTGHLIVCRIPNGSDEIKIGTVITFKSNLRGNSVLITHRVKAIHVNEKTGAITYTTRGDNAPADDGVRPAFEDVVGIYTGKSCSVLGYAVGFLQSTEGAVTLIITVMIFIFTVVMISYINHVRVWRNSALSALNKIRSVLSKAQIEELKTIADIVGIINKDPETKKELKRKDKKLEWFLITGALPKRPYKDDLCPTDAMSVNVEEMIPYLRYVFPTETEEASGKNIGGNSSAEDTHYGEFDSRCVLTVEYSDSAFYAELDETYFDCDEEN